jgi:putative RecB family exonuclease
VFPTSLSPSRSADYQQCPLLYRFKTIDQLPEEPSIAAVRGTLVHSVLENIFDAPAGKRTYELAISLFTSALEELADAKPEEAALIYGQPSVSQPLNLISSEVIEKTLAPVRPLLETYFAMEDPNRLEPHARELALSVELDEGFSIRGFIDRVDRTPSGDIRIVDYKSGKAPSPMYAEKAMFQMRFYGLAWWRINGELPRMLQLMYLGNGQFLRYEPTQNDLLVTERKILALRSAIANSSEQRSFLPTPSKLCGWCSFKPLCPEFGGTPPPLPEHSTWTSGSSLVEESIKTALELAVNELPQ